MPPIAAATSTDLPDIVELLASNGLPTVDVTPNAHFEFLVVRGSGRLAGVVAIESFGHVGLLRSLAVRAEHRGEGFGTALTRAAETHAARTGLTTLVLLTQTAEQFFRRRGYRLIDRKEAPAEVQKSSEFQSLCPASAVCMVRELDSGEPRPPR